jgi:site-specific recombinase XerD
MNDVMAGVSPTAEVSALLVTFEAALAATGRAPATRAAYGTDALCLMHFLRVRGRDVPTATSDDVAAWVRESARNPRTRARRLAAARALFAWARRAGVRDDDPAAAVRTPRLPPPRAPSDALTDGDLAAMLAVAAACGVSAVGARLAAALHVLVATGASISELCAARVGDYDAAARTMRLGGESRGAPARVVPLPEAACAALAAWMPHRARRAARLRADPGWLFLSQERDHRPSRQGFWKAIARCGRAVGIAVTPRRLRNTAASRLLDAGASVPAVAFMLGCADDSRLRRLRAELVAAQGACAVGGAGTPGGEAVAA